MAPRWMNSNNADDPAALSFELAKDFQDSSRSAAASGNRAEAESHRRVSDDYLDDAITKREQG